MARHDLPQWSPRVPQEWVRRFYENDANELPDEDLIDNLAYGLLARCQSVLAANKACDGIACCPICGQEVAHRREILVCPDCDWSLDWQTYFTTIHRKQLYGAEPVQKWLEEFVKGMAEGRTVREKTILIDRVIHGWHWAQGQTTRPCAINLIEGRLTEIVDFLDSLTYGPSSTSGLNEQRQEWIEKSKNVRSWAPNPANPE